MLASKTLLMTAAVLAIGCAGTAHAATLLNSTNNVGVHTPVANAGVNTNLNAGTDSARNYRGHTAAGVNADGSLNARTTEPNVTSGTDSTRQHIRSGDSANRVTNTQADADMGTGTRVYSEESTRNEQMREDMNNNTGVHAGANVRTGSSLGFNE